jgi:hypothetical protein
MPVREKAASTIRRQRILYNSPARRAQRQPPPPPDEAARVKGEWHEAKQAVVAKNRDRIAELERTIRQERLKDTGYHNGKGDAEDARRRKENHARNQEELARVDRHFEPRYKEAAKRNPID